MGVIRTGLLVAGVFTAGATYKAIDTYGGDGAAKQALHDGFQATADIAGEGANAVPAVAEQVAPAAGRTASALGGLLPGGAATTTQPGALSSSEAP